MESSTPKDNKKHPFDFDEKDGNDNPEQTGKSASNLTQELLKAGIGEKGDNMELGDEIDPSILDETITEKVNDDAVKKTDPKEKSSDWAAESATRPVKLTLFDFDGLFNNGLHPVPGKGNRKVKMQKEPEDKTTLPENYPNVWQLARGGATREECILAVWKYDKDRRNKRSKEKLKEKVKARKAANTNSGSNLKSSHRHDDTTTVSESSEDWIEVSSRKYERKRRDDDEKRSYKRGRSPSGAEGTTKRRDTKVTPASKKTTKSTKTEKTAMTDEAILKEYPHMVMVYGSKDKKCPITNDNFSALAVELNKAWLCSKPRVGAPEPSVSGTAFIRDHGIIKCDDAPTAAYYKELLKHPFKAGQFRAWTYGEHDGWTDGSVYVTGKHFPNPRKAFIERALMGRGLQHDLIIKRTHKVELGDIVYLRMKTETANAIKTMPDNTIPAGLTKLQFRFDKPEAAASETQVK